MSIEEIIRKTGLKATPQRKMIYGLMMKLRHSPIDEIIAKAQKKNPEITTSTVYRILDMFCKKNLLSKINHPTGEVYYDITPTDHHHIFNDGEVIDYINPELSELIKKHLKGDLFKDVDIEKISIQIFVNNKS